MTIYKATEDFDSLYQTMALAADDFMKSGRLPEFSHGTFAHLELKLRTDIIGWLHQNRPELLDYEWVKDPFDLIYNVPRRSVEIVLKPALMRALLEPR